MKRKILCTQCANKTQARITGSRIINKLSSIVWQMRKFWYRKQRKLNYDARLRVPPRDEQIESIILHKPKVGDTIEWEGNLARIIECRRNPNGIGWLIKTEDV